MATVRVLWFRLLRTPPPAPPRSGEGSGFFSPPRFGEGLGRGSSSLHILNDRYLPGGLAGFVPHPDADLQAVDPNPQRRAVDFGAVERILNRGVRLTPIDRRDRSGSVGRRP